MNNTYKAITVDGKQKFEHRVLWEKAYGEIPEGMQIDHINGDRKDNRLENLRCVTNQQNCYNHKDVKGFYWEESRGKFVAQIMQNYKNIFLGRYDTIVDARAAYLRKYRELLGADFNGRT